MKHPAFQRDIDAHFAGTIAPRREHAMRGHLSDCDDCRGYYERHLLLAHLDPMSLSAEERLGRGLGVFRRNRFTWVGAATGVVAMAAAILFFAFPRAHIDDTAGFTARGGPAPAPASRVLVYEVRPSGPELAGETVRAGEELAFAYENRSAKRRLMVFGVDEHRRVYWFFPAWELETDNPVAIPIAEDETRHPLPEGVRQHFGGQHLDVRSVFLNDAMSVRDVETLLEAHPTGPLPIAGAVQSSTSFTVVQ